MRTSLALSALALLASPYFFAYLEAERLLGWPEAVYRWFDPWLPLLVIVVTSLITFALPWALDLISETDECRRP